MKVYLWTAVVATIVLGMACFGGSASEEGLAPEFALSAADGTTVRLTRLLAERDAVVVVFHRGRRCTICVDQFKELQEAYPFFRQRNAELVAISTDNVPDTVKMVGASEAKFYALADFQGTVATSFGVMDDDGAAKSAIFVIGDGRKVLQEYVGREFDSPLPIEELLIFLDTMSVPIRE
ncbi:MAG: redoxin domain-containing protein [Chloroflexi bacterium]|nr:redoxin domain-containing protein [Chloroflexota bacterium]